MAVVFPSVRPIASDDVSQAERDVLDALAMLPPDWQVIHSLWLKTHKVKLHAEADFILVTDRAILILEVKGGNVWRDEEGWHFQSKFGHKKNTKKEGPFDQARGAYYALREHLESSGRKELFDDYIWGYGVICPECVLNISQRDAFVDPCMLLDERGFPGVLQSFVEKLTTYWVSRYGRGDIAGIKFNKNRQELISSGKRSEIVLALRPAFELVIGPGASSVHSEKDLIALTEHQLAALDFISMEPRNLLLGSAGTGKTILAVEQARRKASEGKKVLLLCFNKLLARRLTSRFSEAELAHIDMGSYHQFVISLCKRKGVKRPIAETWDEFCIALRDALEEIFSRLGEEDYYDYLVIDEAQDLMSDEFMDLADLLLRGGLKNGSWMMACDLQQAIFRGNFNKSLFTKLSGWARKTPLKVNCRNTRQIAAYVTGLSGVGSTETDGVNGETPVIRYFDGVHDYLRILKKLVNELIQSFLETGLPLSDIVILYGSSEYVPSEIMKPGFFLRMPRAAEELNSQGTDTIQVCSVQGFKGLEGRAVVLVGISDFSSTAWRDIFYVGASRARTNLRVILPNTCQQVKSALPEIMKLLHGVLTDLTSTDGNAPDQ